MTKENSQLVESDTLKTKTRLYYIDWLRVFATIAVLLFHTGCIFTFWDWLIKNGNRSLILSTQVHFFADWLMPIFFILSGVSIYYSVNVRKTGQFIKERILRLFVPFITVGIFIISPPQIYLTKLANNQVIGSFLLWYPHYFEGVYPLGNFAPHGLHLWYLLVLFMFSFIFLPILIPWKKSGKSLLTKLAGLFKKPLAFFLLVIPLYATEIVTDILGIGIMRSFMGGWSVFSYMLFFIYGYLFFSNIHILDFINKYCMPAFFIAFVLSVIDLILIFKIVLSFPYGTSLYFLVILLRSTCSFCWMIAFLGFGSRFLNVNGKILKYANEAVLPFYILHHAIIVIIGFYIIKLNISIGVKFGIISILSLIVILGIYELIIRRINVLRFLFGLKWKRK